jgi:predicted SnoaL-like aldol condensation-catalyzing enzyme
LSVGAIPTAPTVSPYAQIGRARIRASARGTVDACQHARMTTLTELMDRYVDVYHQRDEAGFRAIVADGCIRHDPGSTRVVPIEDNVARFWAFHEQFPNARFTNAVVFEQADVVTVGYTIEQGDTVASGIEIFRFVDGVVVEVWNAPVGPGAWT